MCSTVLSLSGHFAVGSVLACSRRPNVIGETIADYIGIVNTHVVLSSHLVTGFSQAKDNTDRLCTGYRTAGVDKRVRSTSLYHCRQCI